jgi:hypothetical protein
MSCAELQYTATVSASDLASANSVVIDNALGDGTWYSIVQGDSTDMKVQLTASYDANDNYNGLDFITTFASGDVYNFNIDVRDDITHYDQAPASIPSLLVMALTSLSVYASENCLSAEVVIEMPIGFTYSSTLDGDALEITFEIGSYTDLLQVGDSSVEGLETADKVEVVVDSEASETAQARERNTEAMNKAAHNALRDYRKGDRKHVRKGVAKNMPALERSRDLFRQVLLQTDDSSTLYSDADTDFSNLQTSFYVHHPQEKTTLAFDRLLCLITLFLPWESPMLNYEDGYIAEIDSSECGDSSDSEVAEWVAYIQAARLSDSSEMVVFGWTPMVFSLDGSSEEYPCRFELHVVEAPSTENPLGEFNLKWVLMDPWTEGLVVGKADVDFGIVEDSWITAGEATRHGVRGNFAMQFSYDWGSDAYVWSVSDSVAIVRDVATDDTNFKMVSNYESYYTYDPCYWESDGTSCPEEYLWAWYDFSQGLTVDTFVMNDRSYEYVDDHTCTLANEHELQKRGAALHKRVQSDKQYVTPAPPSSKFKHFFASPLSAEARRTKFQEAGQAHLRNVHANRLERDLDREMSLQSTDDSSDWSSDWSSGWSDWSWDWETTNSYECVTRTFYPEWGICPTSSDECDMFCGADTTGNYSLVVLNQWDHHGVCMCIGSDAGIWDSCKGWTYSATSQFDDYLWDSWQCPTTQDECEAACGGSSLVESFDEVSCGATERTCKCVDSTDICLSVEEVDTCADATECDTLCGGSGTGDFTEEWLWYSECTCLDTAVDAECLLASYEPICWHYSGPEANAWWDCHFTSPVTDSQCTVYCEAYDSSSFEQVNYGEGADFSCSCFDNVGELEDYASWWVYAPQDESDCEYECEELNSHLDCASFPSTVTSSFDSDSLTCTCTVGNDGQAILEYVGYEEYDPCSSTFTECFDSSKPLYETWDYSVFRYDDGSRVELNTEFSFFVTFDESVCYDTSWSSWEWCTNEYWGYYDSSNGFSIDFEFLDVILSSELSVVTDWDSDWMPVVSETLRVNELSYGRFRDSYWLVMSNPTEVSRYFCEWDCVKPGMTNSDVDMGCYSITFDSFGEPIEYEYDPADGSWTCSRDADGNLLEEGAWQVVTMPEAAYSSYCWLNMEIRSHDQMMDAAAGCSYDNSVFTWFELTATFEVYTGNTWSDYALDGPLDFLPYIHDVANDLNEDDQYAGNAYSFTLVNSWWLQHDAPWDMALMDGTALLGPDGTQYVLKANYVYKSYYNLPTSLCPPLADQSVDMSDDSNWDLDVITMTWNEYILPANAAFEHPVTAVEVMVANGVPVTQA